MAMSSSSKSRPEIRLTSFNLSHETLSVGEFFDVHVTAEAEGDVVIGSYVFRISHPVRKSEVLPGFDLYVNSRAYMSDRGSYNLMDNGERDLDPKAGAFGIRVDTLGWPEGIHYLTIFAHNRPHAGRHIVDYHNFSATVEGGEVILKDLGGKDAQPISAFESFSVKPEVLDPGGAFEIHIKAVGSALPVWSLHHPYTIPADETLPGFEFNEDRKQAYYGRGGVLVDNGPDDLDPEAGVLRVKVDTTGWPAGVHNFTMETVEDQTGAGPYGRSPKDYRDFAVKVREPKDDLKITVEPDRYFGKGTHFNTSFVLSNNRIISGSRYSDDKGHTWESYENNSLEFGTTHAQTAMMSHEFADGTAIGLAYRTLPREGDKGIFIGKLYETRDGGKSIQGPFDAVFYVPRAVGSKGHAYHPGPLYMRSIVETKDGALLALMCGWFDTDTKESPVKGQNYRRSFVCRSTDAGHTWEYYSTIAYKPNWGSEGWNEGALRRLPNGDLIAAVRSGSDSAVWKDNPLCLFFSSDEGQTWSPPHRCGIDGVYPSLVVMSNGILACSYGRPGAKIMFSKDNGKTWTDHTSIHPERYSGYTWIVEVSPGELLYGFGLRNGLDPETGERRDMLRLTNIHVSR